MSCFVTQIDLKHLKKIYSYFKEHGFSITKPPHTYLQAKKPQLCCTVYLSGKLVIQGKQTSDFVTFFLEPEILRTFDFAHPETSVDLTPRIGIDEAGKGDFFGPLCVGGVYANEDQIKRLIKLKVGDSKRISDKIIMVKAKEIEKICDVISIQIYPPKYNKLYEQFKNLNRLLAWGHSTCIQKLHEKTGCCVAIIDKFATDDLVLNSLNNSDVHLTQKIKGESDIVVAAASIIARYNFLSGLSKLEKTFKTNLPKGAGLPVKEKAKKIAKHFGTEIFEKIAKVHFKTYSEILAEI